MCLHSVSIVNDEGNKIDIGSVRQLKMLFEGHSI